MYNRILAVLATAALIPALQSCSSCSSGNNEDSQNKEEDTVMATQIPESIVIMETTLGTMKIRLYNETPAHRDNFLKLTREGFYDGIRFHRVINGFMIQGGDPLSKDDSLRNAWGTGGPGYTVPAEFVGTLTHKKGALAAARQGDMANPRRASSGSQFYIVQSEEGCRHLDGQYTVYGEVVEGLEVIDRIASVDTDPYDRPLNAVTMTKVYELLPEEPADSSSVSVEGPAAADSVKTAGE